ncbi:hypothetical protein HW573_11390 [Agrobacterium genomosp. 3]|nr:hypothetical protein [Agrobacterium tumefaciens]MCA1891852.1 hypothetical protein [Agrobacterium tomkonis]
MPVSRDSNKPKKPRRDGQSETFGMGNSGIRRSDFLSNDDYARAVHEAGGPGPNERFVADGLGEHTRLLQAIHGVNRDDRQELFQAELAREIGDRPHVFVKKWKGRLRGGYLKASTLPETVLETSHNADGAARQVLIMPKSDQASRLIDEAEFAELYSACEFAHEFGLPLDTMITVTWSLLGCRSDDEVKKGFQALLKCIGDWLGQRGWPCAYIYCHENSAMLGLHSHIALHVPGGTVAGRSSLGLKQLSAPEHPRRQFKAYVKKWVERRFGCVAIGSVRITGALVEQPWLTFLRLGYMTKGFERGALVQSAKYAPDGRDVFLGDLIPFRWRDPGPVSVKRCGVSQSLGPTQRRTGVPGGLERFYADPVKLRGDLKLSGVSAVDLGTACSDLESWMKADRRPAKPKRFQSAYERGSRDVRELYPQDFVDRLNLYR